MPIGLGRWAFGPLCWGLVLLHVLHVEPVRLVPAVQQADVDWSAEAKEGVAIIGRIWRSRRSWTSYWYFVVAVDCLAGPKPQDPKPQDPKPQDPKLHDPKLHDVCFLHLRIPEGEAWRKGTQLFQGVVNKDRDRDSLASVFASALQVKGPFNVPQERVIGAMFDAMFKFKSLDSVKSRLPGVRLRDGAEGLGHPLAKSVANKCHNIMDTYEKFLDFANKPHIMGWSN